MSDGTKIEWTDATWNVVNGCTVHSPGCANCYAMLLASTRLSSHPSRKGLARMHNGHAQWTGEVRFNEKVLADPLRWKRPRKIFVCAHGDLFHEKVPDEWIDRVFAVMALCPQHQFQVLTKRAQRMRDYFAGDQLLMRIDPEMDAIIAGEVDPLHRRSDDLRATAPCLDECWPLPNVWLGVSVEDQVRADERIPLLLDTPAAVRWLSCEPLLGPVDLESAWHGENALDSECWGDCNWCRQGRGYPPLWNCQAGRQTEADHDKMRSGVDWVVVGGESGPSARPMHPDWALTLRDQCAAAGVPFLFKQWGQWAPGECAAKAQTRTEQAAWWFNDHWDFGAVTPGEGAEMHRDDGPDVWRFGKKASGRLLDGQLHDEFPA